MGDEPKSPIKKDLWKHRHKNEEMFTSDVQFKFKSTEKHTTNTNAANTVVETSIEIDGKNMIAVIGNRFMNGGYLPAKVLEKSYKKWNGTLHDINHMGTSTGFYLMQSDITYFIGYHSNVKYNKETKEVSMELNINGDTKFAEAWKGYVSLCEQAGQIPNVSVTYYGKRAWVKASELSEDVPWKQEGYTKDDLVPILNEITPICVSTVLQGRCNDKDGCGIRNDNDTKECKVCSDNEDLELKAKIEEKRQELINWLKENK